MKRVAAKRTDEPDFIVLPAKLVNYYGVLGVAATATQAQIKARYYQLSPSLHPDLGGDHDLMAKLNEAYSVLRDPEKRKLYDQRRKLLLKACPACKGEGVIYKTKGFTRREAVTCRSCRGSGTLGENND